MIQLRSQNRVLNRKNIAFTLLLSGLSGFCLGLLNLRYQAVIDYARVLAGVIEYPHSNPLYIFSVKGWSILTQISVFFLHCGIPEKLISFFWSGVLGMISIQALSLGILALTSNVVFSILSSFFVFFIHGFWLKGFNYPISLLGTEGTFGSLSLSFPFLTICLIALCRYRLGALLLGLAPAIHATQGFFCNLIVLGCLVWSFREEGGFPKQFWQYLFIGYVITGISLAYQLSIYDLPKISPALLSEYKYALIFYWSEHLRRFNWFSGAMARVILSFILSIWGLLSVKRFLPHSALFILRSFIISVLFAAGLSFVYWLPPEMLSGNFYNLLIMEPARIFNYNLIGSVVLLLGLLWYFRNYYWVKFNLAVLLILLALYRTIYHRLPYCSIYEMPTDYFSIFLLSASALALILVLMPKTKSAYLKLNISAYIIGIFYFFTPLVQGSSFVALTVIFISNIAIALSIIFLKQEKTSEKYRKLFLMEGIFLGILGLLWIFTKSQNPVYFQKFSLARLYGIYYLYTAVFVILVLPYLQLSKFTINIRQIYRRSRFSYLDRIIFLLLGTISLVIFIGAGYAFKKNLKAYFYDYANNKLYAELNKGKGMVLTGPGAPGLNSSLNRRPLLYYGTPNNLIYSIEAAPEFSRIFKVVYGVDFLNPPEESLTSGLNLPKEAVKTLWENRTPEQWKQIKKEFNVGDIVTLPDWKLKLPEALRDDRVVLYKIP